MKRLLLLPLLLLGGAGLSGAIVGEKQLTTWTDQKGLKIVYRDLRAIVSAKANRDISMVGDVDVTSSSQGLKITSRSMDIHAIPDTKNPKAYVIQHALAKGEVHIQKQITAKDGGQTTEITGTQADFNSGPTESVVKLKGPVSMTSLDSKHKQTMTANGKNGVAKLEPSTKSGIENGLREATLDGDTHLVITQIDPQTGKSSTVRTRSDHLLLQNIGTDRVITLIGNVHISGDQMGDMTGVQSAVLTLDKDGNYKIRSLGDK